MLVLTLLVAGCLGAGSAPGATTAASEGSVPFAGRIGHVFVIVLENEGYDSTFGSNGGSKYLAQDLVAQGRLLTQYYAIGHSSLDNYVAMISGQAPNPQTQNDCFVYSEFHEVTQVQGQAVGQGCIYPKDVHELGAQLAAAGVTWRAYAEDMAASAPTVKGTCRHPAPDSRDPWEGASSARDQYATKHEPFVYFHEIIDDPAGCDARVVDLKLLGDDLNSTGMPRFAFLSPNLCSDGHDAKCADGQEGGYQGIDRFLRAWVPRILASPAYRRDGLIVITFDESDGDDSSACCNEQPGYNTLQPGLPGPGGGRIGALLLSPCFAAGSKDDAPYNHYSLLRTIEDLYGVPHLGYAGQEGLKPIDLGACSPAAAT